MKIEEIVEGMKESISDLDISVPPDDMFDNAEKMFGIINDLKGEDIDEILLTFIGFICGFHRIVALSHDEKNGELVTSLLTLMTIGAKSIDEKFDIIKKIHEGNNNVD